MIIQLNDKYRISTDEYNFILQETSIVGDKPNTLKKPRPENIGKTRYKEIGNYRNLKSLLDEMINREMRLSKATSFQELQENVNHLLQSIDENLHGLLQPLINQIDASLPAIEEKLNRLGIKKEDKPKDLD